MTDRAEVAELWEHLRRVKRLARRRDVEGLIRELANPVGTPGLTVRQAAARSLAKLGDARATLPITALLTNRRSDVRATAAVALRDIGDARATPALLKALNDPDWLVRAQAANALSRMAGPEVVDALLPLLGDDDLRVRGTVAQALAEIGDPRVVPAIERTRQRERPWRRRHYSKMIRRLRRAER